MAPELQPKPMRASAITMTRIMVPTDANVHGNVHGGAILRYIDEAGAAASHRHARTAKVVTVALERMDFKEPVFIGELLHIHAAVRLTGRTSMLVGARVEAENVRTGDLRHTSSCWLTYVALNEAGRPVPVAPVLAETDEERQKQELARRVQETIRQARQHGP